MTGHAYTEDQLVEQPAIGLFAELGWQTLSAMDEVFGPDGTLGRETSGEVALSSRLRAALERLNPQLPQEAVVSAGDELTRDRSKRLAIEDTLDEGLPRTYTKELYNTKCEVLFEHVYESYQGDGGSVYAS